MSRLIGFMSLPLILACSSCIPMSLTESDDAEQPEAQNAEAQPQEQQPHDEKKFFDKVTAEVVDAKKALAENPDLREFHRQGLGDDYLSQVTNAAVYLTSEVEMLNMKRNLQILEAEKGRKLTYEEFMDFVKQNGFTFSMLKPWQMYGYDEDTGEMMILQDEAEKKRRYQEADIEDRYREGTL